MPKKSTAKNQSDSDPENDLVDNQENFPEVIGFEDFFGDGTDPIVVQIERMEPKFFYGQDITGYLGLLGPDDTLETIAEKYGGGRYIIRQKVRGRFKTQKTFRIAGPPKVSPPPTYRETEPPRVASSPPGAASAVYTPTIDVAGVAVPISEIEQLKSLIVWQKMVETMFPVKPDVNDMLLQLAIGRNAPDMLSQVSTLTEVIEKVKNLAGGDSGSGAPWWAELGRDALGALGKLLDKARPAASAIPGIPPAPSPVMIPDNSATPPKMVTESVPGQRENMSNNQIELAEKAASYIADHDNLQVKSE